MSRNGRAKVLSPSFLAAFLSGVHRRAPRKVSTMAAVQTSDVTTYQMYIGGRWVDASNRETSEILDPSSENVIARVPRATVADAETAVKAARAAFDTGPWPRMKAVERGEILRRAATRIRERAGELARLESLQMGKLFSEAIVDMSDAAYTFDYYAGLVVEAHGETLEVPGETMSMVVRLDHEAGVVVERVGRVAHVDDRLGEELAHLQALQASQLAGALADPGSGPSQDLAALDGFHARPRTRVERRASRLDGRLRVGDGRPGYAGDHVLAGWVEDLGGLTVRRVDPASADVHLVGSHVRCLDCSHCAHLSWGPAMHAGKGEPRGKTGLVPSRARYDSYQTHSHWDWRNNTSSVGITGEGVAACEAWSRMHAGAAAAVRPPLTTSLARSC